MASAAELIFLKPYFQNFKKGSFINYVDQLWDIFDHLLTHLWLFKWFLNAPFPNEILFNPISFQTQILLEEIPTWLVLILTFLTHKLRVSFSTSQWPEEDLNKTVTPVN